MNNTARLAEIDQLLESVPKFECKAGCADCCGLIAVSKLELKRIVARTGIKPEMLKTSFRLKQLKKTGCLDCPLLDSQNKCSVYDIRPAICRVYGASDHVRLQCPHGLKPEKPLTVEETNSLMDRVMALGGGYAEPFERNAEIFLKAYGRNVGNPL